LKSIKAILFVLTYQLLLVTAFILGGWPGKLITQGVAKFMKYEPKYFKEINGSRNYPYYYLYRNKIVGLFNK
jgi:hypothetical protein